MRSADLPPIIAARHYTDESVFDVVNLMRAARRQKHLSPLPVPSICVLDPDGDLVEFLRRTGQTHPHAGWACYHTALDVFTLDGVEVGIVGRAVGAPFAVLVAEELFVAGCQLLLSVTSAGQISPLAVPPYFSLIVRALRDEGTSYHYLPPARYTALAPNLYQALTDRWNQERVRLYHSASWTTDAPFRETAAAIAAARAEGIAAVEMEAAALYALATAKGYAIVCFAHVTNTLATSGDDGAQGRD
jgi:uridine phosphorylase